MLNKINSLISSAHGNTGKEQIKVSLSLSELLPLLRSEYNYAWEAVKNGRCIYRGSKNTSYSISIQTPTIRKSQNTENYYNTIVSELLPSWKNTVKRNKCLICTNSKSKGNSYGTNFLILPHNDSRISFGKGADFWDDIDFSNFDLACYDLSDFNNDYESFLLLNRIKEYIYDYIKNKKDLILSNPNLSDKNTKIITNLELSMHEYDKKYLHLSDKKLYYSKCNVFNYYSNIKEITEYLSEIRQIYTKFHQFILTKKPIFDQINSIYFHQNKLLLFCEYINNNKQVKNIHNMLITQVLDKGSEIPFLDFTFSPKRNDIITCTPKEYITIDNDKKVEHWVDNKMICIYLPRPYHNLTEVYKGNETPDEDENEFYSVIKSIISH